MYKNKILLSVALFVVTCMTVSAQTNFEMKLWSGRPEVPSPDAQDTAKVYVYLPAPQRATGRAVVICPGGGYDHLAMRHEGTDWAQWFTSQGIAAIVLKYRLPHGKKEVPLSDAAEAIRLVRRHATAWHLRPDDVGVMGFSAGGHLASVTATHAKGQAKPDFQILFYPVISMVPGATHQGSHDNLLGRKAKHKEEMFYSTDTQVNRTTPRAFILLGESDQTVSPFNGLNYYRELYRHDVPAAIYMFTDAEHGFGFNPSFRYHYLMLEELRAWLRSF